MARKKWRHKTQEEKEATLNKIAANSIKGKTHRHTDNRAVDILHSGDVPLHCFKHGYFAPKKYELCEVNTFGEKYLALRGNCPICGEPWDKAVPSPASPVGITFALVLRKLVKEGRVYDTRSDD